MWGAFYKHARKTIPEAIGKAFEQESEDEKMARFQKVLEIAAKDHRIFVVEETAPKPCATCRWDKRTQEDQAACGCFGWMDPAQARQNPNLCGGEGYGWEAIPE